MNNIDIAGIGTPVKPKPPVSHTTFLSLSEYQSVARKLIVKLGPKCNVNVVELLRNDDAVSNITTSIMMADWNYDNVHTSQNGRKCTRRAYRGNCAKWAIYGYITRRENNKGKHNISLDSCVEKYEQVFGNYSTNASIQRDVYDILEVVERSNTTKSSTIKPRTISIIKMYYFENNTLKDIGAYYGVSRQRTKQIIDRGLEQIREILGVKL